MMCARCIASPDQIKLSEKDLIIWGILYAMSSYLNRKNKFEGWISLNREPSKLNQDIPPNLKSTATSRHWEKEQRLRCPLPYQGPWRGHHLCSCYLHWCLSPSWSYGFRDTNWQQTECLNNDLRWKELTLWCPFERFAFFSQKTPHKAAEHS